MPAQAPRRLFGCPFEFNGLHIDTPILRQALRTLSSIACMRVVVAATATEVRASRRIWTHWGPDALPAIPRKSRLGDLGVPSAESVNVEIEDGSETCTGNYRRNRDSASPILHVVFTHA